ncbi:MAG: imidazole glycerol phosphate synthase subunit HisF [Candidatus Marinimicrobia bacterium]|nr:imidazole glycerol phosphate synthase subunit HisF [Candidatus Neomarinimicrobiota bacterium]
MLNPRIIPCLLVRDKGLVKTVNFKAPKYVGDPLNAVKIFNEKGVDELIVLDIDATIKQREPNYKMIANLAMECRMPLCYGGGINNKDQALRIFELGVEKIAISSAALENPKIVSEIAGIVGNQSVIVVLDVKKKKFSKGYNLYTHNGKQKADSNPVEIARKVETLGCGEIVINSIDHDGVMKGYDKKIINEIRNAISIPMTVLGGAGTLDDIGGMIREHGIIGVAAGSLFVFKGKYKAVLINYPNITEKENLIKNNFKAR